MSRPTRPSSVGAAANRSIAASASATSPSAPRSSNVSTSLDVDVPEPAHHHVRRRPDSTNAVAWVWRSQCGDHPVRPTPAEFLVRSPAALAAVQAGNGPAVVWDPVISLMP